RALVRGARRLPLLRRQIAARERRGRLLADAGPYPPAAAVDGEPAHRAPPRAARPTVQPGPRSGRRDTPPVRTRRVSPLLAPDGAGALRPFARARRSQVPAAPPRELRLSVAGRNSPGDRRARLVRPAVLPSRDTIRKALLRRVGRDDLADDGAEGARAPPGRQEGSLRPVGRGCAFVRCRYRGGPQLHRQQRPAARP